MACEATLRYLRDYIKTVPARSRFDRCDLSALFEAVLAQYRDTGEINIPELGRQFQVFVHQKRARKNWPARKMVAKEWGGGGHLQGGGGSLPRLTTTSF